MSTAKDGPACSRPERVAANSSSTGAAVPAIMPTINVGHNDGRHDGWNRSPCAAAVRGNTLRPRTGRPIFSRAHVRTGLPAGMDRLQCGCGTRSVVDAPGCDSFTGDEIVQSPAVRGASHRRWNLSTDSLEKHVPESLSKSAGIPDDELARRDVRRSADGSTSWGILPRLLLGSHVRALCRWRDEPSVGCSADRFRPARKNRSCGCHCLACRGRSGRGHRDSLYCWDHVKLKGCPLVQSLIPKTDIVCPLFSLTTLLAAAVPARRASRVDLMWALRQD